MLPLLNSSLRSIKKCFMFDVLSNTWDRNAADKCGGLYARDAPECTTRKYGGLATNFAVPMSHFRGNL